MKTTFLKRGFSICDNYVEKEPFIKYDSRHIVFNLYRYANTEKSKNSVLPKAHR